MVELRYLKEEINIGDGIEYEPRIVTKLQYRNVIKWYTEKDFKWGKWKDVPTEWINKESDILRKK